LDSRKGLASPIDLGRYREIVYNSNDSSIIEIEPDTRRYTQNLELKNVIKSDNSLKSNLSSLDSCRDRKNSRNDICLIIGKSRYNQSKKYSDIATCASDVSLFEKLAKNAPNEFKTTFFSLDETKEQILSKMTNVESLMRNYSELGKPVFLFFVCIGHSVLIKGQNHLVMDSGSECINIDDFVFSCASRFCSVIALFNCSPKTS
jgi:hypothetical protein